MLHGSETSPVRKENEVALQRAEMRMARWMCVIAENSNIFKTRLDKFWHNQDIMYDFRVQLEGTGSRSEICN